MRLFGVNYRRIALVPPFGIGFGTVENRAQFHFVARGPVVLRTADGTLHTLGSGDAVLLPRGGPHELLSAPDQASRDISTFETKTLCKSVAVIRSCPRGLRAGLGHADLQRLHGVRPRRHAPAGGADAGGDAGRHAARPPPRDPADAGGDGARGLRRARRLRRDPGAAGRCRLRLDRPRLGRMRLRRRQGLDRGAARPAPRPGHRRHAPRPRPGLDGGRAGGGDGRLALGLRRALPGGHRPDPAALRRRSADAPRRAMDRPRPDADRGRGPPPGLRLAGRLQPGLQAGGRPVARGGPRRRPPAPTVRRSSCRSRRPPRR